MLFLVDSQGVPSVAKFVKLEAGSSATVEDKAAGRPDFRIERREGRARVRQGGRRELVDALELGLQRQPVVAGGPGQHAQGEQGGAELGGRLRIALQDPHLHRRDDLQRGRRCDHLGSRPEGHHLRGARCALRPRAGRHPGDRLRHLVLGRARVRLRRHRPSATATATAATASAASAHRRSRPGQARDRVEHRARRPRGAEGGGQQLHDALELGLRRQRLVAGGPRKRPVNRQGRAELGGRLRIALQAPHLDRREHLHRGRRRLDRKPRTEDHDLPRAHCSLRARTGRDPGHGLRHLLLGRSRVRRKRQPSPASASASAAATAQQLRRHDPRDDRPDRLLAIRRDERHCRRPGGGHNRRDVWGRRAAGPGRSDRRGHEHGRRLPEPHQLLGAVRRCLRLRREPPLLG